MIDEHRRLIDPEGRYPAPGLTQVEEHAVQVLALLPHAKINRTRDVIQLDTGDELGIIVLVTPEALELRLPTIEWTQGTHGPAQSSRIWKRVLWRKLEDGVLAILVAGALEARRSEYRRCKYCDEEYPPERRIKGNVCHGCAERHERVVF